MGAGRRMSNFPPPRFQFSLLNGCRALVAFDDSSQRAHSAANRLIEVADSAGLGPHTFRNSAGTQMIRLPESAQFAGAECKGNVKDHLPLAAKEEAAALGDYAGGGHQFACAGTIFSSKMRC